MSRGSACCLVVLAVAISGTNCPNGLNLNPSFPRTTEWPEVVVNQGANQFPAVTVVADLNTDGLADVIAGYPGSTQGATPQIIAFLQVSPTQWAGLSLVQGQSVAGVSSLAVGDLDGDGLPDVIAGCNGQIVFLRQPSTPIVAGGWPGDVIGQSNGANVGIWTDVALAQIDRAVGVDIVACNSNPGQVSWFRSPLNPLIGQDWQRFDIDIQTRSGASAILATDVDGDGNPDVISTARSEQTATIAWYRHPGANVLNGQLAWQKFTIGNLGDATRLDMGDLNRDGRPDVVVVSPMNLRVAWYAKPADVFNQAWVGLALADFSQATPTNVKVADVDQNGQPDVIVSTANGGALRWLTPVNDVQSRWIENNVMDLDANVARFSVADIDRDGKTDVIAPLIASDPGNDHISWFRNPER